MATQGPPPGMQPGQLTREQYEQLQAQLQAEAARHGMSVQEYVQKLRAEHEQAMQQQAQQQQQQQQQDGGEEGSQQQQQRGGMQQQQVPINPGPPKPEALAVAKFLRAQPLKLRTCIFQEKRKDLFRVKRAIRALQSPAYEKARTKNALLPPVTDRASAENVFKLLPLSLLALRVDKIDPHEGHNHGKKKRVKGLWTVRIEQQQDTGDDMHYMWFYEGSQWKQKAYAALALVGIMALVLFPLWPIMLRQGVWYLSMGMLGLLGLFFVMAIFRLILFCITVFAVPPGIWLYPNLFEDVGFFDSFRPLWAWHQTKKEKKKTKSKQVTTANGTTASNSTKVDSSSAKSETALPVTAETKTTATPAGSGSANKRIPHASVEEVDEE